MSARRAHELLGWSGVVNVARTSRTDKAIGPPLGKEGFSALLFGTITTEEVLHTQTTRPSDSTHVLIMWRGYDTCGSPSSYAGYAESGMIHTLGNNIDLNEFVLYRWLLDTHTFHLSLWLSDHIDFGCVLFEDHNEAIASRAKVKAPARSRWNTSGSEAIETIAWVKPA